MTNKNLLQADKKNFTSRALHSSLVLRHLTTSQPFVTILKISSARIILNSSLEPETDPVAVARVNLNYIPALLLLHRHYSATGETDKAARLQNLSLRIARAEGGETEVRAFFAPEQPASDLLTAITPKALEKNMKKVSDKLYAADTELTNGQYDPAFLTDLLKNKDYDQLDLCKTAKTDWISLLPKEIQNLPAKQLFKHGHPDSPECPVQNVSHEAAQRYCAWVTQVYNASPDKKKFKKVLFRLPTETEWITAARGGLKDAPYPWPGGFYVRNSKGCYLGNYDSKEPCGDCPAQTTPVIASADLSQNAETGISGESNTPYPYKIDSNDGGFFTVPAASYYPNKFGLFAVSGNVAEMIAEPGKAKGGVCKMKRIKGKSPR